MKTIMQIASALLLSAVVAAPASATYFSNSKWNTGLNIGSAKSPTPAQLRALYGKNVTPAALRGSTEITDEELLSNSSLSGEAAFGDQTVVFTNVKFAAMEGKTVIGAHGERLGHILAVDQTNRLAQVQTPSGIAVSMSTDLLSDRGKTVRAATTSKADIVAMAKTQTGRTVAINLGVRGNLRG